MDWRDYSTKMALKLAPALLLITTLVALLIGVIFYAISIDEVKFNDISQHHGDFEPNVIIDDKFKDLIWFLQVTDLHISSIDPNREEDFKKFTKNYISIIKPEVVLVTGDITDARTPNTTFGSGPRLDEWLAYSNAIKLSGNYDKTTWLDIRGNHDNFNVYRPKDPNTLFRKYSIQGKDYARNYMHIHQKDGKNYSFIAVDEVQTPGLKIPFNFIGLVDQQDVTELKEFKKKSKLSNSQYNIWFAHYPTSSVASPGEDLRDIVDGPYLCGHFHTIGNMVTKMHSTQQPGYAEVELGDWKHNRLIRLAAIDHQLFSFVDVKFNQFPIALMTNPKQPEYLMPKYEPLDRIVNSTHIRVIAFSNVTLNKVQLSIDDGERIDMINSDGPLYALRWPADYSKGLHTVKIYVNDIEGKDQTYRQTFSMDKSKEEFTLGARILIRGYFVNYVMSLYFFTVTACTLPMLSLKFMAYRHNQESNIKRHYKGTFLYNLHLLSHIDRLFWPLFIIPLWLTVMPNFIGYMVDEAIGACFVWGIYTDGKMLHSGITYNVGSLFLLLVHIPHIILFAGQVSDNYKTTMHSNSTASIINIKFIVYILVTALHLFMGSLLYSAYGLMSYLTSFNLFWCLIIYAYLWYQCTTISKMDFINFNDSENHEEEQALTAHQRRDDKSSTSDL